ncbi:non-homologous end joining protein Ku [Ramlibacter alkalitolerans]|uniref:Non-homologous end joining protein Ku n=1 Tax=Ramlibacter alkalitolerans TaxID=2039631 RepID=A0ABS1JPN6_9BURK|nr:Ku protein [Ramlibacter alkalitolerans]MBL0426217.1 Ku protein [Ramlibacter alkalitolerans]
MADTKGMAKTSTRSLWKGAITFGLVHIPVGLYSATEETDVDFDWLDRRTLDPVGYKRINKRTGKEIAKEDVVKGVQFSKGQYVVLSPDEIAEAYPRTTQTIEIAAFMDVNEVPFVYLEKPYYTAPINKGEKVYALLREALRETGKAALARVVIRSKQHLAVVLPCGPALVLNLLRWGGEIRSWEGLNLPAQGKAAGIRDTELAMARHLIEEMSGHWHADELRDNFHDAVMKLVEAKAKAGEASTVEPLEPAPDAQGADVIDLTELLRRSLKGGAKAAPAPAPARAPAQKAASRSRTASQRPEAERAVAAASPRKKAGKSAAKKSPPATTRAKRAA